jgi:hypothetical protein
MDKWLTVPPDFEPVIGTALALYSLYRPKKKRCSEEYTARVNRPSHCPVIKTLKLVIYLFLDCLTPNLVSKVSY